MDDLVKRLLDCRSLEVTNINDVAEYVQENYQIRHEAAARIAALEAEAVSSRLAHDCGFNAGVIMTELAAFRRGFERGKEMAAGMVSDDEFWTDGQCTWSVFLLDKYNDAIRAIATPEKMP